MIKFRSNRPPTSSTIDYALQKDNRIHGALAAICPTWPSKESPLLVSNTCDKVCGAVCAESSSNSMEAKTICQANYSSGWSGWCDIGVSQEFKAAGGWLDSSVTWVPLKGMRVEWFFCLRGSITLLHDTILAGGKDPSPSDLYRLRMQSIAPAFAHESSAFPEFVA